MRTSTCVYAVHSSTRVTQQTEQTGTSPLHGLNYVLAAGREACSCFNGHGELLPSSPAPSPLLPSSLRSSLPIYYEPSAQTSFAVHPTASEHQLRDRNKQTKLQVSGHSMPIHKETVNIPEQQPAKEPAHLDAAAELSW